MLVKVKKALLLSDVATFSYNYKALAEEIDVELTCESEWSARYRIVEEVVILGSKFLNNIHEAYYPIAVIILREGESPAPYIKKGITKFIFNYKNNYELLCALYKPEATIVHANNSNLESILSSTEVWNYQAGDYNFRFDLNKFIYKGKQIYLSNSSKKYLAEWLLNGNKDNAKRMILCNLRKKFGSEFLADVNRFGELKGGKNEQ